MKLREVERKRIKNVVQYLKEKIEQIGRITNDQVLYKIKKHCGRI